MNSPSIFTWLSTLDSFLLQQPPLCSVEMLTAFVPSCFPACLWPFLDEILKLTERVSRRSVSCLPERFCRLIREDSVFMFQNY